MHKIVSVVLLLMLTGCAAYEGYKEGKQLHQLESITFEYENAVRWGDFVKANAMRKDKSGAAPDLEKYKRFKISNYDVVNRAVSEDKLSVRQVVEIRYYNVNTLVEKTYTDYQVWEYNKDSETWRLKSNLPLFK